MILIADAKTKITKWVEKNIINKIPGEGKRVVMAVVVSRAMNNIDKVIPELAKNPILAATGIIDGESIDENILIEIREKLGANHFDINIPMIGTIGIDGEALDDLYKQIKS